ncbi:hypothetical protein D9M70_641520 [compost metagenome]
MNQPWRPIGEIVQVQPRLATADGRTVDPASRGLTVTGVSSPDGFSYTVLGDSRGLVLFLDLAEIRSPLAFLSSFEVNVNELTPNSANSVHSDGVQLGDWFVPELKM